MSLVFNKIIDTIFKAFLFIMARVNISRHGAAFATASKSYNNLLF